MQSEVFDAFRTLGVPEDKALKAAEALGRRDADMSDIKRHLVLLQWQLGAIAVLLLPSLWLLVRVASKVGVI